MVTGNCAVVGCSNSTYTLKNLKEEQEHKKTVEFNALFCFGVCVNVDWLNFIYSIRQGFFCFAGTCSGFAKPNLKCFDSK